MRFYRSEEEWSSIAERLKLTHCPHFLTAVDLLERWLNEYQTRQAKK
ncbi:hypothetical protein KIH39_00260 [Telmatocola sphagniphila]|uniref:Uncharacterized protein n=1 Tax=Telmatocola sphagniphila TaxID=1123043 RepID=A0A8E6B8B7_9BACT|nr:hypothetical protein [Telmatocola sphagniphila]QVL32388.1 hypothetical protein KIH39_00260 [Telmatocola sphagniphila]